MSEREELEPHGAATLPAEDIKHPGPREYVVIAVVLAVITAIEVAVYYVDFVRPVIVPVLLVLAIIKFSLVALWFMHLRFDSRIYRRLFVTGILLALSVFVIVLLTFGVFLSDA